MLQKESLIEVLVRQKQERLGKARRAFESQIETLRSQEQDRPSAAKKKA